MSKPIFENSQLNVTSFAGPANTLERTRMRLQIEVLVGPGWPDRTSLVSLGFNDVQALHTALDRWLAEYRGT